MAILCWRNRRRIWEEKNAFVQDPAEVATAALLKSKGNAQPFSATEEKICSVVAEDASVEDAVSVAVSVTMRNTINSCAKKNSPKAWSIF